MVLESILSPEEAERQPFDMLILGFAVSSLALWLAYYVFPKEASNWFLFLTAIAVEPLLVRIFKEEEGEEIRISKETLWARHDDVVLDLLFLFFGMVISFSFWFTILPSGIVNVMFENQISEIMRIQNLKLGVAGGFVGTLAAVAETKQINFSNSVLTKARVFKFILVNNLRLMFLFVAFSFLFGAGAILLLTWNAAVVGAAVGNMIRVTIVDVANLSTKAAMYFKALPVSILSFFVHGIFEILGYFLGAIAGGILSVAIIRKHYESPHFKRLLWDVILLLTLASALIIIGAGVEVYITPIL
ncbi:MAG: stage II sporulation protein M [Candidatus Undinarchaeales archaeon]